MALILRKSLPEDIPAIMELIGEAQEYFRNKGIDQWQNGYPNPESIMNDIALEHSFVLEKDAEVVATAMISFDGELTYDQIDGEWLTDQPYVVVHRVAVKTDLKGQNLAGEIFDCAEQMCRERGISSFRVDTHEENLSMQRVLAKRGFHYCGVITVSYGAARMAFEKVLK